MAAKQPFWEIQKKPRQIAGLSTKNGKSTPHYSTQPWSAHLKGRNGRIVVTTETYRSKKGVLNAISVVDPDGRFEVKDLS